MDFAPPSDMADFFGTVFGDLIQIQTFPVAVASISYDEKHFWSMRQSEHAVLDTDLAVELLSNDSPESLLAFDPRGRQIEMAELCLQYIAQVPRFGYMTETEKIEACAEHPFLQYASSALSAHAASAPLQVLTSFVGSELFKTPALKYVVGTLLPAASKRNDSSMVAILITVIDPNVREKDSDSHTALTHAAINGNMDIVSHLLSLPTINVDMTTYGNMTALNLAIQQENLEVARTILSRGHANALLKDANGWNSLRHLFTTSGVRRKHRGEDYSGMSFMSLVEARILNTAEQMIRTIDQIFLSTCSSGTFQLSETEIETARQNGHEIALDHLMKRYHPSIVRGGSRHKGLLTHSWGKKKKSRTNFTGSWPVIRCSDSGRP